MTRLFPSVICALMLCGTAVCLIKRDLPGVLMMFGGAIVNLGLAIR